MLSLVTRLFQTNCNNNFFNKFIIVNKRKIIAKSITSIRFGYLIG